MYSLNSLLRTGCDDVQQVEVLEVTEKHAGIVPNVRESIAKSPWYLLK